MSSIIGQCSVCCECPYPTVYYKTRSTRGIKQGFPEFIYSTPRKYYRTSEISGSYTEITYNQPDWGGSSTTLRISWSGSATKAGFATQEIPETCVSNTQIIEYEHTDGSTSQFSVPACGGVASSGTALTSTTSGYNVPEYWENYANASYKTSDNRMEVRSNEYTTANLKADTLANIPAFSPVWLGITFMPIFLASANLDSSEQLYTVTKGVYRFSHKIPKLGNGSYFGIRWVERFTPEDGGNPTDTIKTYVWDGVVPPDYIEDGYLSGILTPEYTVNPPVSDGAVSVHCITWGCLGTLPDDPCNP